MRMAVLVFAFAFGCGASDGLGTPIRAAVRGGNASGVTYFDVRPVDSLKVEAWPRSGTTVINPGGDTEEQLEFHVERDGPPIILVDPPTAFEHFWPEPIDIYR